MKRLLLLLFCIIPVCLFARNKQGKPLLDSLIKAITHTKEDTFKVAILNKISAMYWEYDPDQGISYGQQGLALSQKLGWKKGVSTAYVAIGVNYRYKSEYQKSLEYYRQAIQINEEIGYQRGLAAAYSNMGVVYVDQSDYAQALDYGFRALKINEASNNKVGMSGNLTNIGLVYDQLGDYAKALEYHTKAMALYREINDRNCILIAHLNLGIVYREEKNYPAALENITKAMQLCEELGNKTCLSDAFGCLGDTYKGMGDYEKALEYLSRGIKLDEELGNKESVAEKVTTTGLIYLDRARDSTGKLQKNSSVSARHDDVKKAIEYLSRAAAINKEIGNLKALSENYRDLSTAYELSGNDKEALQYHKLFMVDKDSVFSQQNKIKLSNLESRREIELKDKQILIGRLEIAKKRNEAVFYIVGIVLLLLVIVFVYRNYASQKKLNVLLSREKKRSEDLLLNILPFEVANELKAKGSADAKNFENVTVLFTDFVNFTGVGEKMTPQELINELHICFKAFDGIIDKYKIEKIKTIGDAYLVVSGLPVPDANHAEHIVRAAIEMSRFMQDRVKQLGDKTFQMRIGIHTGNVVAGIVGVKKFAYDIWGDTVNVAARMEQSSEPGKINISQTTYDLVNDKFFCTYRGEIDAKNKGKLGMYFVEGPKS